MNQLAFAIVPPSPSSASLRRNEIVAPDPRPTEADREAFRPTTGPLPLSAEPPAPSIVVGESTSQLLIVDVTSGPHLSEARRQSDTCSPATEPDRGAIAVEVVSSAPSADPDEALIGSSGLARRALISDPRARPDTLAGCFDFVANHTQVPTTFRALLPAARKRIAREAGHDLAALPADPAALRPLLVEARALRRKLSRSRWNAHTILRSVLILAGWHAPEAARRSRLPQAWENLLVAAGAHAKRGSLARFFRHCHRTGKTLDAIDSEALVSFEVYLTHSTLDPAPRETALLARSTWAFMQAHHPEWPRQELQPPPRGPATRSKSDHEDDEPLIGASGLAGRTLIADPAARPETLAACFDFVFLRPDVPETFRRELPAARDHIGNATGRDLVDLPASPVALRPLIAHANLHKRGLGNRRWNAETILRSVLILTGWYSPEARLRYKLPQEWEALLTTAEKHGKRRAIAAFLRHCHRRGLRLSDITTETLVDYVEWLAQWTLDPAPWSTAARMQQAWKAMQTLHAAWPTAQITLPPLRRSPFAARADIRKEPLIEKQFRANRALISDATTRPASVGACFDFIASHPDVPARFRRDVLGAKATLARLTKRDTADLSTDPVTLRPVLASVQPIQFGLSNKRWRNILALVRSTLIMCGWLAAEARKRDVLPQPWHGLASDAKLLDLDRAFAPFFRYCVRHGLTPETISPETLDAYLEWLTRSTLEPEPRQTALWVQRAWRRVQRYDAAWPRANINLPSRRVYKRRTDFTDEFHADVAAYLDSLRKRHPRDRTYRQPLSPAAIRIVKNSIVRAATYLANVGTPTNDITGIATLVKPEFFEKILLAALDDAGGRWNVLAKHIAANLLLAARRWVKPSEEVLKDLKGQTEDVQVGRSERRRRDLLAQFATVEDRDELFDLPWRAFEQADLMLKQAKDPKKKSSPGSAAKLHEVALAMALLFTQPIRIGNLVALDIDRHLRRDRGKLTRLFIDADEVKNRIAIEIFFPEWLAARIVRHLDIFRPILLRGAASTALFPGKAGQPMGTQTMGKRMRRIVERQIGAKFTPHLARHLMVEILLEADVNNLRVAQRLLGHTQPSTTETIYGGPRTSAAQQTLARLVENDRRAAEVKDRKKQGGPARGRSHDRA